MNIKNTNKNISQVYDRDNICLFAIFKYTENPNICFIVANIHVLYNNSRGDVKLAQIYQTINTLQMLKEQYGINIHLLIYF